MIFACSICYIVIKKNIGLVIFMIYVGIDAASDKHDFFMMNDEGKLRSDDTTTIKNNVEGFTSLTAAIHDFSVTTGDNNVRIGIESTGHYSHNILHYLVYNGFDVMLINPILTNMERKSFSVRKTKTDKIDATSICRFLMRNHEFKPYTAQSYHTDALKSLSRRRRSIVKQLTKEKQILHALVTTAFPEMLTIFSKLTTNSALEILLKYAIPSKIAATRIDTLTNTIYKASKGHHGRDTARALKELAVSSIGAGSPYYAVQIRLVVQFIRFLQSQVEIYNNELKVILDKHFPKFLLVPGVGYVTAACIIGEIGNISRFSSADKLLAYAGLDPSVYQSGSYNANSLTISKRGSSYLRWAIHQVSFVIVHKDNTFSNYYLKKRGEGKHHLVALGHVSKKLTRVIFSLLKSDTEFVPQT